MKPFYNSSIPDNARGVVRETYPEGEPFLVDYVIDDEWVGYRSFDYEGRVDAETAMRNGKRHGN